MYFLGMVVLYVRGFFIRKSKQKKIEAIIFLVLLFLFRLHFGIEIFLNTILDNIAYFLVIGVMDKIGFITIYSNCKIIYEETSDMVSSKKKTKR